MRALRYLKQALAGFRSDERGSIAVEAVVILPMLFWTYLALYSTFHSYRTYAVNQKAAYTIGDMISRQTEPLDADFLDGTWELFMFLTNSLAEDTSVRVTVVHYDDTAKKYYRDWSQSRGYMPAKDTPEATEWAPLLPEMAHGDRVIVVETYLQYDPPFDTGLEESEVRNFVFTKPRYAPQVLWKNAG